jgi:acyl-coenzyme A thioesterase PaaI-like protein
VVSDQSSRFGKSLHGRPADRSQRNRAAWLKESSESELRTIIPVRAQVEKERIETEFRTASGITNGAGKFVAGVVLITAGYAAEGKYSNFLIVQVPLKLGDLLLKPGTYVFGWKHDTEDSLTVSFYESARGKLLGTAEAMRTGRTGRVESFRITPPQDKGRIQIGRFAIAFEVAGDS